MRLRCLKFFAIHFCFLANYPLLHSQGCCSGGSGSPIAGNASQGVLAQHQMELASSLQYIYSDKFLTGNGESSPLFQSFSSKYLYNRVAYGITKDLTISLEGGYYLNKTQTELNAAGKIQSSGFGDMIIFPRYDILNRKRLDKHDELTIGLGYKIPLGKYNDSHVVFTNPTTGRQYFTISPPLVQPTNGSQDVLFYLFYMHSGWPKNIRFFANSMYIKKGWNALGEKFGDFTAVNVFVSRTFMHSLGITLQCNAEWVQKMRYNENVDVLALYNVDVNSTGSKKISLIPQFSYSYKTCTIYGLAEVPLYQKVQGTQIGIQQQFTMGLSYRFFTKKDLKCDDAGNDFTYMCPMKCKGGGSNSPGICSVCGMQLDKVK
ncbi:MAG: hypothetical protein KG003_03475 [Bacteroidetes bacterium]|nr:hypothetical protein [Bacteroidota bacterium]